jgi:hypothetical protein
MGEYIDVTPGSLVVIAGASLQEKKGKVTKVETGKYRYVE